MKKAVMHLRSWSFGKKKNLILSTGDVNIDC